MVPVLTGRTEATALGRPVEVPQMAARGRKRPRVTEPVTAIVEGESVGDVLLYDGRSDRIAEVYDWRVFVKALGVYEPGTA